MEYQRIGLGCLGPQHLLLSSELCHFHVAIKKLSSAEQLRPCLFFYSCCRTCLCCLI